MNKETLDVASKIIAVLLDELALPPDVEGALREQRLVQTNLSLPDLTHGPHEGLH